MRPPLALPLVALCIASAAGAQAPAALAAGARVRLVAPRMPVRVGELVSLAGDSLHVRWSGGADTTAIAWTRGARLYVSRGRQRGRPVRRALIVGASGIALGAIVGQMIHTGGCRHQCSLGEPAFDAREPYREYSGALALGGGVAGAVIGAASALRRVERWTRVPFGSR